MHPVCADGSTRVRLSWTTRLHGALLCALYALVGVSLLLALLGVYRPLVAILLAIPVAGLTIRVYFRAASGREFFESLDAGKVKPSAGAWCAGILGAAYFAVFIVYPLWVWPDSGIFPSVQYDALLYHFPRAIQLVHTGSLWDNGSPYSQYPCGYELLVATVVPLADAPRWFGAVHAATITLLYLTLVQMLRKGTRVSCPLAWSLAAGICSVPCIFWYLGYVGGNDMLLHAVCLSCVLHAPIAGRGAAFFGAMHPAGLAISSMLALATKPNSLGIVVPCWVLATIATRWSTAAASYPRLSRYSQMACLAAIAPGLLWIVRNFALIHRLITPDVAQMKSWCLLVCLGDPRLYTWNWDTRNVVVYSSLALAALAYAAVARRTSLLPPLVCLGLLGVFAVTPASAWGLRDKQEFDSVLMFRYITQFVAYALVVALASGVELLTPFAARLAPHRALWHGGGVLLAGILWSAIVAPHVAEYTIDTNRRVRLERYVPPNVGPDEYRGVYDFLHATIRGAKIFFDGQIAYYCYGPGYTNTLVDDRGEADYFVSVPLIPTRWTPEYVGTPEWDQEWQLWYRDPLGVIYERRSLLGAGDRDVAR